MWNFVWCLKTNVDYEIRTSLFSSTLKKQTNNKKNQNPTYNTHRHKNINTTNDQGEKRLFSEENTDLQ